MREKLTIPSQREPSVALMLDASGVLQTQNLTWGENGIKMLGGSREWEAGGFSWSPKQSAQAQ